jgi:hypothetical protein
MAVFALNSLVGRTAMRPRIVLVTLEAGVSALVLYGEVLPFLDIAEAMIVVGKTVAVNPKVIRHHKQLGEKNETYYPYCNPQGVQDVPLHVYLSLCLMHLKGRAGFDSACLPIGWQCLNCA